MGPQFGAVVRDRAHVTGLHAVSTAIFVEKGLQNGRILLERRVSGLDQSILLPKLGAEQH